MHEKERTVLAFGGGSGTSSRTKSIGAPDQGATAPITVSSPPTTSHQCPSRNEDLDKPIPLLTYNFPAFPYLLEVGGVLTLDALPSQGYMSHLHPTSSFLPPQGHLHLECKAYDATLDHGRTP